MVQVLQMYIPWVSNHFGDQFLKRFHILEPKQSAVVTSLLKLVGVKVAEVVEAVEPP